MVRTVQFDLALLSVKNLFITIPMQKTATFNGCKNDKFQLKGFYVFLKLYLQPMF